MFDDLIKTVKSQLYDRVTSPLFSCFFISWLGWNYKFVFVLFSGLKISEKFQYIDTILYPNYYNIFLHGIVYPLLTTLFIIYIYPYPARYTYRFYRRRQVELKEIQQAIDDDTPLTKEEAKKIRKDAFVMNMEFESEIEKLREENIALRGMIKSGFKQENTMEKNSDESSIRDLPDASQKELLNKRYEESEGKYIPIFNANNKEKGNTRLLITGEELVKASIEKIITEGNEFNGHSFMVNLKGNDLIINLISKNGGKGKVFKYRITIPSDGRVGYENLRIQNAFREDFQEFLNKNESVSINNE